MLLSSCNSLFLFSFIARLLEYWNPSLSLPLPPLFHLQPTVTWFPAEASIRTALVKLVIQSSADLISIDTSLLLKTSFPLASVTCHSPGFFSYFSDHFCLGFVYQQLLYLVSLVGMPEFCPRHSSYPILISQKITSTSLTLNTMREFMSYSRMAPLQ